MRFQIMRDLFSYLCGWRPIVHMHIYGDEPENVSFHAPHFRRAFELWRYYRSLGFR